MLLRLSVTFFLSLYAAAAHAQPGAKTTPPEEELPSRGVLLDIDGPTVSLYKLAVPDLGGTEPFAGQVTEVLRRDLTLSAVIDVLGGKAGSPLPGAQGTISGALTATGTKLKLDLRLTDSARGTEPVLNRSYNGGPGDLRGFAHDFANQVLLALTGERGVFGSRLTFARKIGPNRKDVFVADMDGHGVGRISLGQGTAMLPSFGPGGVWYSRMTDTGMFITRGGQNETPIIDSPRGLNMGVTHCDGRVFFSSTRDGNAEIYSARPDGSDLRRLTNNREIDVSPTCGPGGRIAFVSGRHGGAHVFTMSSTGADVRRVTFRGNYNQTPSWCPDPRKPLIAFTGRAGGDLDIFVVNLDTRDYIRVTQNQGTNKDPSFSPDCRLIAFASSRGGIFVAGLDGAKQQLVIPGHAETVRWSR